MMYHARLGRAGWGGVGQIWLERTKASFVGFRIQKAKLLEFKAMFAELYHFLNKRPIVNQSSENN